MLVACANPSSAQHIDSLVCFTIGEAIQVNDTLWSRLDQRERVRLLSIMMGRKGAEVASLGRDNEALRLAFVAKAEGEALAIVNFEAERGKRMSCEAKAKGKGLRGFLWGVATGAVACVVVPQIITR